MSKKQKNMNNASTKTSSAKTTFEQPKKKNGEKTPRDFSKLTKALPYCYGVVFALAAWLILAIGNKDYLFGVQNHSLWSDTRLFFDERMALPGGFVHWLGCYLTQYFYYPALGSAILVALWVIIYVESIMAFRLKAKWSVAALLTPVLLLCSVICLGYWMYYIKNPGFWFKETLGVLIMMSAVLAARYMGQVCRIIWVVVWCFFGYPIVGWYALLGTLLIAILGLRKTDNQRFSKWVIPAVAILSIIATPIIWYQHYSQIRIEDAWIASFPLFQSDLLTSIRPSLPFILLAIALLLTAILTVACPASTDDNKEGKRLVPVTANILIIIALVACVKFFWYDNYNYKAELRMAKAVEEQRWDDVLYESSIAPGPPTRQMVISKNIALLRQHRMGEAMFHYDNRGEPPYVYDSLKVHLVQTFATTMYYHHGKTYFSTRWCIENGVEFGFNVNDLKILTKCSIVEGEYEAARKYIEKLKQTTFHKAWAEEYERYLNNTELIAKNEEFKGIKPLMGFEDLLDSDGGLCEMYIINYFANSTNKDPEFSDVILAYTLVDKNIQLFWPRFFNYAMLHKGVPMPIHYQEAAYLYGNLEHEVDIKGMPFDQEKVVQRFGAFQQMTNQLVAQKYTEKQMADAMRAQFGDTFWYFYFLVRDVKSY